MKPKHSLTQTTIFDALLPSFSATAIAANQEEVGPKQLKEEAIKRVKVNADQGWMKEGMDAIKQLCRSKAKWTADDLWAMLPRTKEPRALGALVVEAQFRGWCEPTSEYIPSTIARRHSRPVRVWRSLSGR